MSTQEFVTKINLVNEETFQETGGSLQLYGKTHLASFSANTVSVLTTPISGGISDVVLVWDSLDKRIKTVSQSSIAIQSPAAGNDTEVQFNKTGTTTGDPTFIFNYDKESLTLGSRIGVSGIHSFSQGCDNEASGYYSSASGYKSKATGIFSHTQGGCTLANSLYSHAEGFATSATSSGSHSEGGRTLASGAYSHSEGCFTDAGGVNSHAEGYKTYSNGSYSHAQGCYTNSSGIGSHSGGVGTATRMILACNTATFNHSFNDTSQTLGNGALAPYSAILGGKNHNIGVANTGATIIGGDTIKLTGSTYVNTTVVGNLAIINIPLSGSTSDEILVRNPSTGKLEYRDASSLGEDNNIYSVTGVTGNVTLSSDFYVILVDSSGGALTVTLPSSPTTNQAYKIKDKGNALTNNITIDGNGNNLDGSSTALINTDYGALELLFDDSEWFSLAFIN